jgi:hypothetical protein
MVCNPFHSNSLGCGKWRANRRSSQIVRSPELVPQSAVSQESEMPLVRSPQSSKRAQLSAKNLTVIQSSRGRAGYSDPGLQNIAIQNIAAVSTGVHPTLNDRFSARITQCHVFRESPERISNVVCAISQGGKLGVGQGVRHFLKTRHVLGLDLRHPIQLRIVDERRQSLMLPLRVDEIEDAPLCRAVRARIRRPRWRNSGSSIGDSAAGKQ